MTCWSRDGTAGFSRIGETGARFRIPSCTTAAEAPVNGAHPAAISYKTAPSEKMSVRASNGSPAVCSGDM